MERNFRISGPINSATDYYIPFEDRIGRKFLYTLKRLVFLGCFFSIQAPRQSGKTSLLQWFGNERLNHKKVIELKNNHTTTDSDISMKNKNTTNSIMIEKEIVCVFVDFNSIDYEEEEKGVRAIISQINISCSERNIHSDAAMATLKDDDALPNNLLIKYFNVLCSSLYNDNKILVLIIDEVDSLRGDTGVQFFRQCRVGFNARFSIHNSITFPFSIILIAMRHFQEFSFMKNSDTAPSPFNIHETTMKLPRFTKNQVLQLFQQHTTTTGQVFEDGLVEFIYEQTRGQPWLCNRIGKGICFDNPKNLNRSKIICF